MADKTTHLSKTDLRRGLFTKAKATPAPAQPSTAFPSATSAAEQDLLFDLPPPAPVPKTRPGNSVSTGV